MQVAVKESYYDVPKYAMSAEIENNKEDNDGNNKEQQQQQPPKKPIHKKLIKHWQIGIKLLELIFSAISIGFIHEPIRVTSLGKTHLHQITLIYGTFVGYCIINCVFVLTRLLRDRLTIRTSMTFTAIATILFSINGILLFTDKKELTRHSFFYPHLHLIEMLTVSASFSLLNGLLYLIDTVLTYKYAPDVE